MRRENFSRCESVHATQRGIDEGGCLTEAETLKRPESRCIVGISRSRLNSNNNSDTNNINNNNLAILVVVSGWVQHYPTSIKYIILMGYSWTHVDLGGGDDDV